MVNRIFSRGKKIFLAPQASVLSAASVIMLMIVASRVLGLARHRVLLSFFKPDELSLFFAAFRLPDLVFEVLTLGALSSAFIPVFTRLLKRNEEEAWDTAGRVMNLGLLIFAGIALLFGLLAVPLYSVAAPGYSDGEIRQIAYLARVLFAGQGFFVMSYVLTGVLESQRRFLVPALAPLFYNLGIILGTVVFSTSLGLYAPAVGVVIGAGGHFLIQLPLAYKLGLRFSPVVRPSREVKEIGRLAGPRMVELSVLQVSKMVELYLASIISTASYTYYTLANSVQLLPVGLFGVSLAKAALPTLTRQADEPEKFKRTVLSTWYQMIFMVMPLATMLIVLRIPIVRLLFGTGIFDWPATVQTGLVLSAFAVGVPAQAGVMLFNRAFYALQDTKTPVSISLVTTMVMIIGALAMVLGFGLPTWALALAYTVGVNLQAVFLFYLLSQKLNGGTLISLAPIGKSLVASVGAGGVMFFILKFFDRSVWVKRLSFLTDLEATRNMDFEMFVLDTRYSLNLMILTFVTAMVGGGVYLGVSFLLKSEELRTLVRVIRTRSFAAPPAKETEPLAPRPTETVEV